MGDTRRIGNGGSEDYSSKQDRKTKSRQKGLISDMEEERTSQQFFTPEREIDVLRQQQGWEIH